jgi:hypothetical protein
MEMEVARRFIREHRGGSAAYLALQLALMRHYVARGGTAEEFCARLAPAFRRRWGAVLLSTDAGVDLLDRAA